MTIAAALTGAVLGVGPGMAAPAVSGEDAKFFETRIRPVLFANCFTCHGEKVQQAGLRLDSRTAALKGGTVGAVIVPGNAEKSRLVHAIRYDGPVKMPPGGKLKAAEIAALEEWVRRGAPWPGANVAPVKSAPGAGGYRITPEQRQHWSFRPVRKSKPPVPKRVDWAKNSIDRFILAALEAKGLSPAPPADRRSLLRRATFDLIGLPPTPAEVETFLADRSPDAFRKVVDRLLASPHYGERWGRHWLDVARYADSNGLDENKAFAHAWRYRDYVVNALNKDKPYDQFILEQLAGELLPTNDEAVRNERLTATGFLALGAKVLAEQDKPKLVMDIIDEQIEVTSKAFMGLTVACARCHDHKFDPIPTKDYYALAGIFKSTKTMADLGFVSNWLERPLMTKAFQAQMNAHADRLKTADAALKSATARANENLRAVIHMNTAKYLLAGWEASRQAGLLSLAETPAKPGEMRVVLEAEKFERGNANRDTTNYGPGIGVIHTIAVPTFAEWDFTTPAAGTYQLELRYAAMEARPVRLLLNGQPIKGDAAGQVTGSWHPDTQRWEPVGVVTLVAGKNTLRLERAGDIPHVDKLALIPVTPPGAGMPPTRSVEQIARDAGLIPEVVKRWAAFLRGASGDPVFAFWNLEVARLAGEPLDSRVGALPASLTPLFGETRPDSLTELAERFARIVALVASSDDPALAATRKALTEPGGPLVLPEKVESLYAEADRALVTQAADALKKLQAHAPKVPVAMAVDEGEPENVRVHIRGSTLTLGEEAPRHFLAVLNGDRQVVTGRRSGRLELARWLARPEHPLTARVAVNRLWQGHFGQGLVRTPDNWGALGERPTHPELLDWLAAIFVEQGWSMKRLHRLIMLSSTYQMSTVGERKAGAVDPDNRLLARFPRRRLEAEPFRDAILAVSGKLDRTMGGSLLTTPNNEYVTNDQSGNAAEYSAPRRSLYLPVIRNALFDVFQIFDVGDPTMVVAARASTTVAPQALFVMNSPFVLEQSRAFAESLLAETAPGDGQRVQLAYQRAFARPPAAAELKRALAFISRYNTRLTSLEPDAQKRRLRAWSAFCQLLFASNEFIYLN